MNANSLIFPLPSQISGAKGAEKINGMYPYFTGFRPEDDERFWFYNKMHFPEPMPAFDAITAEGAYAGLGAMITRMFAIPTSKGIEHRIINGRIYISANSVTEPVEIGRRAGEFEKRAFFYFGNWDRLYGEWRTRMGDLIETMGKIEVPAFDEFDDVESVLGGRGYSDGALLLKSYDKAIEGYFMMWQYHSEFLILGYGAYLTFFEFCKKAFPEIQDRTIANMVAGVDSLMFRPDDELKVLARLAVELGVEDVLISAGSPEDVLAMMKQRGHVGTQWLSKFSEIRDPWFNTSSGDGFYHHHRSWNDDLRIPFSGLANYATQLKAGHSLDRPTEQLKAQRRQIIEEYRGFLDSDQDRSTFDQMLGLAHMVFPYVEDHKFYCEHWLTNVFFNKIREFGALLARKGLLEQGEDIFHLNRSEVREALSDLRLAWCIGGEPAGKDRLPGIVAERKAGLAQLLDWDAPEALGPIPDTINDPMVVMLWGVTTKTVQAWLSRKGSDMELTGFGASPGLVEGTARVIQSVADINRLQDGDILVCPVTTPSWAPIFGRIKAAVSDIGGTMSHAAIVAREYGLPAVVGTGSGTRLIKDGQRIRVDGGTGRVTILG
ncbi:PEP-utilizing enzyme [Rhizobium leguminosarum]